MVTSNGSKDGGTPPHSPHPGNHMKLCFMGHIRCPFQVVTLAVIYKQCLVTMGAIISSFFNRKTSHL